MTLSCYEYTEKKTAQNELWHSCFHFKDNIRPKTVCNNNKKKQNQNTKKDERTDREL